MPKPTHTLATISTVNGKSTFQFIDELGHHSNPIKEPNLGALLKDIVATIGQDEASRKVAVKALYDLYFS